MREMFLTFEEARKFVQELKFKTVAEYWAWCKGSVERPTEKPTFIPSNPHHVYRKEWKGYSDFLGTGNIAPYRRKFRPFEDARTFARSLKLHSSAEWRAFSTERGSINGVSLPPDIPTNPQFTYRGKGWVSMADWLGTGRNDLPSPVSRFLPFTEAREFARALQLETWKRWRDYCTGQLGLPPRPANIPSNPQYSYKGEGWINYGDWLGSGNKAFHGGRNGKPTKKRQAKRKKQMAKPSYKQSGDALRAAACHTSKRS